MIMQFNLVGPKLPAPKLRTSAPASPAEHRSATAVIERARYAISRIDRALGRNRPCHWCQSGLYLAIPGQGCEACNGSGIEPPADQYEHERRQARDIALSEGLTYHPGGRILSVR